MTERKAIERIKYRIKRIKYRMEAANKMVCKGEDGKAFEDLEMAIKALEELQEIKKVVEEFPLDCGSTVEDIKEIWYQLSKYLSIGTVEEFRTLKEKNTPMELAEHNFQDEVHHYLCPSCRHIVSHNQNYCEECGQRLEE